MTIIEETKNMKKSYLFVSAFASMLLLTALNVSAVEEPCSIDADCDDGNSCTFDICIEATDSEPSYCFYLDKNAGTLCDDVPDTSECLNPACDGEGTCVADYKEENDGEPCTDTALDCVTAACQGGVCLQDGGNWVYAGAPCADVPDNLECANPGCDGYGNCIADQLDETDGTLCTDTGQDCWVAECYEGVCRQDGNPVETGTPCDDVPDPGECADPVCNGAGACVLDTISFDGELCTDNGNDCNIAACNGGVCDQDANWVSAGWPCDDVADNLECANPGCDGLGNCIADWINEADGTPCGDGGVECFADDSCDGLGSCTDNGPSPAGTVCGNPADSECDNPDSCDGSGVCVDNYEPAGTPCEDGNLCTSAIVFEGPDQCDGSGECTGDPVDCSDDNACTSSSCDPVLGCYTEVHACSDDGDPCTDDTCDPVVGCAYNPISCDDGNACTADSCDSVQGCVNVDISSRCDDGLFCNGTETCNIDDGSCNPGTDPCLVDETCDEVADLCSTACEFAPHTQGYWYRQCLGLPASEGGLDPGRSGKGPSKIKESEFRDELIPCANQLLGDLGFSGYETCWDGMETDPPADPCERAISQLTALILNVCSDRLYDTCEIDLSNISCSSVSVGGLLVELADSINGGYCELAADCAALVNEGEGLVFDSDIQ
jgi:hypothetical protein